MALSFRDREIIRSVCPTCRNDLYNHALESTTPPPTTEKCRLLDQVKYDMTRHEFRCPYWTPGSPAASA